MNYARIYDDFISSRRDCADSIVGYSEGHHIVPRCMGGSDEAYNLIRLTAEDHFFAHLLLAKAHGGKLWAPVAFMAGGTRKDYRPIQSRKRYGWVLPAMARALSGENAHQYDWKIYELQHKDGREWSGRQSQIHTELGIGRSHANMLLNGRVSSADGWHLAGRPPPDFSGSGHPMYRAEIISFIHVDGRRFSGTQHDLHKTHGVAKSMACRLARGHFRCANGWYIEGSPPAKVGRGAKWKVQAADAG